MDQKQKQLLIAVGAVCGIIVLALAYFLFSAVGENADLKKKRDKDMSALLAGNRADPYPSEANRQVREDDAKNAEAQIAEVKEVLAKGNAVLARSVGQPPSESSFQDYVRNTSESSFQTFISRSVSELNQRQGTPLAQRLRGQTAQNQQEEQAYSFERYVHQGTPPTKPDFPRLARQFASIHHVCDTLLDNGAVLITDVQRTRFDGGAAEEAEETTTRRRRSSRRNEPAEEATSTYPLPVIQAAAEANGAGETKAAKPVDVAKVAKALKEDGVDCESYAITFRAPYATIAKTLNDFAADDLFIVVTDLSITSQSLVETKAEELVRKRRTIRDSALNRARASAENAARAEELAKRGLFEGVAVDQRLVSDPETAEPLQIVLRFDVYTVEAPKADEAPDAPTAPEAGAAAPEKEGN